MAYTEGMCLEGVGTKRLFHGASSQWHCMQERPGCLGMGESYQGKKGGILLSGAAPQSHHPCTHWVNPEWGGAALSRSEIEVLVLRGERHQPPPLPWLLVPLAGFGFFVLPCSPGQHRGPARPPRYWEYFCGSRCGYITELSFLISILVQNSNNSPPPPR